MLDRPSGLLGPPMRCDTCLLLGSSCGSDGGRIPHQLPETFFLGLVCKDGLYAPPGESADFVARELEVLRYQPVLVGQGTAEDANVVGLFGLES